MGFAAHQQVHPRRKSFGIVRCHEKPLVGLLIEIGRFDDLQTNFIFMHVIKIESTNSIDDCNQ
jgi:hypothetical protein